MFKFNILQIFTKLGLEIRKVYGVNSIHKRSFILQLICLFLLYLPNITSLVSWWLSQLRYQLIIIFLFLFMLFKRRSVLLNIKPNHSSFGFIPLIIGLFILFAGRLIANHLVQEFSIIFVFSGLVIINFGYNYLRLLFIPIIYLLFSSHLFFVIPENISLILQLISTKVASAILSLFKFNILVNGSYIRLPATTLHVVDLCSGYNQLFTLIAMVIPIAYISHRSAIKQIFLIAFCFPVGIFMNGLRIALIGVYNYTIVRENVHGPYDIYRMPFIFLGGLFFMSILSNLIIDKKKKLQNIRDIELLQPNCGRGISKLTLFILPFVLFLFALIGNSTFLLFNKPDWNFTNIGYRKYGNCQCQPSDIKLQNKRFKTYYEMPLCPGKKIQQVCITQTGDTVETNILWFPMQKPGNEPFYFKPEGEGGLKSSFVFDKIKLPSYTITKMDRGIITIHWYFVNNKIISEKNIASLEIAKQLIQEKRHDIFIFIMTVKTNKDLLNSVQIRELIRLEYNRAIVFYREIGSTI